MRRSKARKLRRQFGLVKKFSRIQNSVWIENVFELAMQIPRHFAGCLRPPAFLGETNPMLARDHAAPGQHLCEKFVESAVNFVAHGRIAIETISHDVDVNVAVAGMTETSDRKSVLHL